MRRKLSEDEVAAANPFTHGASADPEKFIDDVAELLGATKDAVEAKRRVVTQEEGAAFRFSFPDMPLEALDGALGSLALQKMSRFPLAYAWPSLLAAASVLIDDRAARTNLYCALVGPVHSGKSQAIERACQLLDVKEPLLMPALSGSAEQLVRRVRDAKGQSRLFSPDELGHVLDKMHIENSSYSYVLNMAYYKDNFDVLMAKKEVTKFDCVLSMIGGVVEDRFERLFNAQSTAGLYDRFTFGYCPEGYRYDYEPFDESPLDVHPTRCVIDREVWREKSRWLKEHQDWNPRVVEHAIRAAVVAAAFDQRDRLTVEALGPCYEFAKYQQSIREILKPNAGENYEAKVAIRMMTYLQRYGGRFVSKRDLLRATHAYEMGPSNCDRALAIMKANGDIETQKVGKTVLVRSVTDGERAAGAGAEEEA